MCRIVVKYLLFAVNLICTIVGIALIILGVAVLYHLDDLSALVPIDLSFLPELIIILGVIVFLISFCGCCGAITESKCLLIVYAIFMAVLAAVKIYVAVKLSDNLNIYKSQVEAYVNEAFIDYATDQKFHVFEVLFKCCGTTGPEAYPENELNLVAPTCCENPSETTMCTRQEAFQTGCTTMISGTFESIVKTIGMTLSILIVTEVIALASSILIIVTIEPNIKYIKHEY